MAKRTKSKPSPAQVEQEIEEFLRNSPYAEKDKHTKVSLVYYVIPNGNAHAGGWLPVYEENGKQYGNTWWHRGMSKDEAWKEAEAMAREHGEKFIGDWVVTLRKGKEGTSAKRAR